MAHISRRNSRSLSRSMNRGNNQPPRRGRSIVVLLILLLLWSVCLGLGLAQATERPALEEKTQAEASLYEKTEASLYETTKLNAAAEPSKIGTVDVVPARFQLAQELYLENCATCHLGLPPAVLPTQTWRDLLQDSQHYGVQIKPLTDPSLHIVWEYLRTYSRLQPSEDQVPYRIHQSRYFKALHPKVQFAQRVNLNSCVSCHPGAGKYDFRSLSAEWQNAP